MLVWRVRWWWIRRWVSWVAPGKVPRLSMNATSCPNGVPAAADKLPLLRPFLPLPCPPVHWARSSSREGTPSKKGLPVINVFALWHCCSLLFFSCVCLSCNKIIIPYAWLAWLLHALLRSGCASAADRPFLNFTFHGNQNDDDDQIIKIPKHDDIWLIGGRGRNWKERRDECVQVNLLCCCCVPHWFHFRSLVRDPFKEVINK